MVRLLALALTVLAAGCSAFVDLRVLEVKTFPTRDNTILTAGQYPSVTFSPSVERTDAERLLQVTSAAGTVSGDLLWNGDTLTFRPSPPLTPGTRYVLAFNGNLRLQSGKTQDASVSRPFYYLVDSPPLSLVGWQAGTSGWVAAGDEPRTVAAAGALVFLFNRPPSATGFEHGLSLSPATEHEISWSGDGLTATVTPNQRWTGLTRYRWTLGPTLADADGVPLARELRGNFQTLSDLDAPVVSDVGRAARPASGWTVVPAALTEGDGDTLATQILDPAESVRVLFDSLVDEDTLEGALRWEPSLSTTTQTFVWDPSGTPRTLVLITPLDRWIPGQTYELNFSSEIRDREGNRLAQTSASVEVGFPFQTVTSIAFSPSDGSTTAVLTSFNSSTPVPVALTSSGSEDLLDVSVTFSQAYSAAQIPGLLQSISLESYFPAGNPNPELKALAYNPATRVLNLTYRGMIANTASAATFPGARNLYRWTLQADPELTATSGGSYLENTLELYWEPLKVLP